MKKRLQALTSFIAAFCFFSSTVMAADLTIPLNGPISQKKVRFQCDEHAKALGLPAGQFFVEYLNGDGNSLAVIPINGHSLIFSGVLSADGSRYAAGGYIWWDVGSRGIHLYSDTIQGKQQTACRVVP
jgi:membrane-bound inhibitor of C-type lysozyme